MKMIPVESSHLAKIGYDPDRRECRVQFKDGTLHDHLGVSPEKFAGLMSAESHGKYYAAHIKGQHAVMKAGTEAQPLPDEPPAGQHDPVAALDAAARRYRGEP